MTDSYAEVLEKAIRTVRHACIVDQPPGSHGRGVPCPECASDIEALRALAVELQRIREWADVNPECEVRISSEDICGAEAWYWYPADDGGTMALCERHNEHHSAYSKPLPRSGDICHRLAAGFTPRPPAGEEGKDHG